MAKTRNWQVRATGPGGRVVTFGVRAASLPAALLKAYRQLSRLPWIPRHLEVARLYGRHRPVRQVAGRMAGR